MSSSECPMCGYEISRNDIEEIRHVDIDGIVDAVIPMDCPSCGKFLMVHLKDIKEGRIQDDI